MKKIKPLILYLFLFLGLTSIKCKAQETEKISKVFKTKEVIKIDFSILFDKKTGKKLSEKEFRQKTKKNNSFNLEKVINAKGEVEKYFFIETTEKKLLTRDISKRVKVGEPFPEFELKTIKNQSIKLSNLKGKVVIIRFELFADNFRFKKHEIESLDKRINTLGKDNFKAIIIYTSSAEEIKRGFTFKNSNFHNVANGINFGQRYSVTRFPSTIIINKYGNLEGYFKNSDEIDLVKILNK